MQARLASNVIGRGVAARTTSSPCSTIVRCSSSLSPFTLTSSPLPRQNALQTRRLLHSTTTALNGFNPIKSAAQNLSNGIMSQDDMYQNGVPGPHYYFSPSSPTLQQIFAAHDHIDPYAEISGELTKINSTITHVLGTDHPVLSKLANYFFDAGGKRIRPAIVFLISRAMENGLREGIQLKKNDDATQQDGLMHPSATEVNISDLATRPSYDGDKSFQSTTSGRNANPMADFIFNPAAAALDAASTLVALAPKISPVPLPPLPPLPVLPFAPFSYDSAELARRTNGITEGQRRLAEIVEMMHTASLLHDDVIDEAATRRGVPSLNAIFGNKLSILAGDFLLARASVSLSRLRNPLVTESISSILEHLVKGEIMQLKPSLTCANELAAANEAAATADLQQARELEGTTNNAVTPPLVSATPRAFFRPSTLPSTPSSTSPAVSPSAFRSDVTHYITKSYYKTASMLANSCRSAALLGHHSAAIQEIAEEYGKNLGLAFQIIDDLLDIQSTSVILGKPAFSDLSNGVVTAPILFAFEMFPKEMLPIIQRRASQAGDREVLMQYIAKSDAIRKTQRLAEECAEGALAAVLQLKPSRAQSALVRLVEKVLTREK